MAEWIVDPGHAWLKVTINQLIKAMEAGFIPTQYSFMNKTHAFLEEDADAPRFLWAMGWGDKEFKARHVSRFSRNKKRTPDSIGLVKGMVKFLKDRGSLSPGSLVVAGGKKYAISNLPKPSKTSYVVMGPDGKMWRLNAKDIDELLIV